MDPGTQGMVGNCEGGSGFQNLQRFVDPAAQDDPDAYVATLNAS